jgi:hypothetical protein
VAASTRKDAPFLLSFKLPAFISDPEKTSEGPQHFIYFPSLGGMVPTEGSGVFAANSQFLQAPFQRPGAMAS